MLRKKFLPLILLVPILSSNTFFISCASAPVDPTKKHTFDVGAVPNIILDSGNDYYLNIQHTGPSFSNWSNFSLDSSNTGVLTVGTAIINNDDEIKFPLNPISEGSFRLTLSYLGDMSDVHINRETINNIQLTVFSSDSPPAQPSIAIERVIDDTMSRQTIVYGNLDEFIDIKITADGFSTTPSIPTLEYTSGNEVASLLVNQFTSWQYISEQQYVGHYHIKYNPNYFSQQNTQPLTSTCTINVAVNGTTSNPASFATAEWSPDENEYTHLNQTSKDILTYMNTLTFSIFSSTKGDNSGYIGTAWILGKYCTWSGSDWAFDTTTNYSYWMATNLHVRASIDEANKSTAANTGNRIYYETSLDAGSATRPTKSYPTESYSKNMLVSESNYFATDNIKNSDHLTMDFSVLKFSLSNTVVASNSNLKTKLGAVNAICDASSDSRKLAITPASDEIGTNKDLYILGYPSSEKSSGWRLAKKHTYSHDTLDYYTSKGKVLSESVYTDGDGNKYYDTGQIIRTGSYEGMRGGSSGSLVVDDNKNAVAINFAGPSDTYYDNMGYALYTSLVKDGTNGYDLINGSYPQQGGFYNYLKQ